MSKYASHVSNPKTPQNQKAKSSQKQNNAGGYSFVVDDWTRLNRFLILGNENGSYYVGEHQLTLQNCDVIQRCMAKDPKKTINTIVQISDEGRAVKNAPALFALAICSVYGDEKTKSYANKVMPKVARFSTDLFSWVDSVNILKEGRKGKGLLRAIGRWYTEKTAKQLAYQICKYPSRSIDGRKWGHADLLRLAHISPSNKDGKPAKGGKALTSPSDEHEILFRYATHGVTTSEEMSKRESEASATGRAQEKAGISPETLISLKGTDLQYIWAHEKAKNAQSASEIVKVIEQHQVTRESVPSQFRNEEKVQRALLKGMPITALIRNLGSMTASGVLKPLSNTTSFVVDKITDKEILKNARIHPITLLIALKVYQRGKGMRTSWSPVPQIGDALEKAYYAAYKYVEPTGKKLLLGIDVSGSMEWSNVSPSVPMTSAECAAAVAMTVARTEKNYKMMAFSNKFSELDITARDKMESVLQKTSNFIFGGTDCALPMIYAQKEGLSVDCFIVLTDNETWSGNIHPFEALKSYRKKYNPEAKLAVLAFTSTYFSIADPDDPGMLDIVGMDSNVPKILSEFISGKL
jgi:60 kDa SS-A/Ro ribonucleoprotein